ncbi:hypothetical protein Osc7112_1960 [Oscillatoria nigro-viridis PCC 7112]|uniref:Uncharacterized protein n=1 Tax=Phormidium nigroviride PCC 7112 TaxID=179408 RepID=K9VE53_9CYAN|nr:hypothetical protein Osc7112_1960 [Oscillatoria nigro-viridis PCC 7112]
MTDNCGRVSTDSPVKVVNLSRRKRRKPLFHVPIFQTASKENCLGELGRALDKDAETSVNRCRRGGLQTQPVRSAHPTKYEISSGERDFLTTLTGLALPTLQIEKLSR